MSVKTYNELREQVKRWTRRTDIDDIFDTIIEGIESDLYPRLRVQQLIVNNTATCVVGDRTLILPASVLEFITVNIVVGANTYRLNYVAPGEMQPTARDGMPTAYTVTDEIIFDARPDQAYQVAYCFFQQPAKLTASVNSNVITNNYPDIFFHGARWLVHDYASEPDLAMMYRAQYDKAVTQANRKYIMSCVGPNPSFAGQFRKSTYYGQS